MQTATGFIRRRVISGWRSPSRHGLITAGSGGAANTGPPRPPGPRGDRGVQILEGPAVGPGPPRRNWGRRRPCFQNSVYCALLSGVLPTLFRLNFTPTGERGTMIILWHRWLEMTESGFESASLHFTVSGQAKPCTGHQRWRPEQEPWSRLALGWNSDPASSWMCDFGLSPNCNP